MKSFSRYRESKNANIDPEMHPANTVGTEKRKPTTLELNTEE